MMEIPFHGRFTTKWTWVSDRRFSGRWRSRLSRRSRLSLNRTVKAHQAMLGGDSLLVQWFQWSMIIMVHDYSMIRYDSYVGWPHWLCETLWNIVKPIFVFFYHCDFGFAVLHASARPQRVDFILFLVSPYRLASDSCCSSSTILVG